MFTNLLRLNGVIILIFGFFYFIKESMNSDDDMMTMLAPLLFVNVLFAVGYKLFFGKKSN